MKKNNLYATFMLLLMLVFSANVLFAQNGNNGNGMNREKVKKTPEEMALKKSERMKVNLSLTDDQYKQVYNMMLERANNRILNKEKYKSMDKDSRILLRQQNKESFNKQLESILNKDQIAKLQELKLKHKEKNGNHKGRYKNNNNPGIQN